MALLLRGTVRTGKMMSGDDGANIESQIQVCGALCAQWEVSLVLADQPERR